MSLTDYPAGQGYRGGCKVAWLFYTSRENAEAAAEIAKTRARRKEEQGYDWGYQMPGEIRETKCDGVAGFEVTIP